MKQHPRPHARRKALAVLAGGLALALAGCRGGGDPLENETTAEASGSSTGQALVVGSADFPESSTIAEI